MKRGLLAVLRFYQRAVSPALPARCRFYPTCSAYAVEALEVHGAARGTWLALLRLVRCAPWHPGGLDPVPHAGRGGTGRARPSSSTGASLAGPAATVRPSETTTPPAGQQAAAQEESSVA